MKKWVLLLLSMGMVGCLCVPWANLTSECGEKQYIRNGMNGTYPTLNAFLRNGWVVHKPPHENKMGDWVIKKTCGDEEGST